LVLELELSIPLALILTVCPEKDVARASLPLAGRARVGEAATTFTGLLPPPPHPTPPHMGEEGYPRLIG
jgi:hypothetical protein